MIADIMYGPGLHGFHRIEVDASGPQCAIDIVLKEIPDIILEEIGGNLYLVWVSSDLSAMTIFLCMDRKVYMFWR